MSEIETIGKYEILSVLGKGGMGVVYKARDPFIDRVVAVKTIRITPEMEEEDLGARLEMEAKSAGRLQHPNICTVYDFGLQDDVSYIVLEYAEGGDLSQVIERKLDLSLPQKIDIIIQIALGLDYAHCMGVVHRDMKPANVRLTKEGVAKLIDFGLARFDTTRLTKTGFMSGTIAYMSPERINGESGESDDIFALGTLAWELLTYERAFPGTAPPEVMFKILSKTPDPPSSLIEAPAELDQIILKCMARDKAERYQTAGEFSYDLQTLVASDEFRAFLTSEERSEGFRRAMTDWEEQVSQGGRFSESRVRTRAGRAVTTTPSAGIDFEALDTVLEKMPGTGEIKTVVERTPEESVDATVVEASAGTTSGDRTVVDRVADAPPTEVVESPASTVVEPVPAAGGRGKGLIFGAVALVAVAALAGVGYTQLTGEDEVTGPVTVTTNDPELEEESVVESGETAEPVEPAEDPETAGPDMAAMIAWQTESNLVERIRARIPDSDLSSAERTAFRAATQLQASADRLFQEGDAADAAVVMAEAGSAFEEILENYENRKRREAAAAAAREARSSTPAQPQQRPVREPVRTPVVTEPVEPQPETESPVRRAPDPPVEPAGPTPEQLRAEIRSFVSALERAYTSKDASFFQNRFDGYTPAIGSAISSSPSSGVSISVQSIELRGGDRATVRVSRTDTFPDRNIPPATQNLVYEVRRANGQWRLVSFSRE